MTFDVFEVVREALNLMYISDLRFHKDLVVNKLPKLHLTKDQENQIYDYIGV